MTEQLALEVKTLKELKAEESSGKKEALYELRRELFKVQ